MKTTDRRVISAVLWSAALCVCLIAGCNSVEFKSHWRNLDIVIDGNNAEWQDSLTYLLEDKQTSVGFVNDDHDLYICIVSGNRDLQRQAMRGGLTFWFDREGNQDQKFGIHYPLGPGRPQGRGGDEGTPGGEDRPPDLQNDNTPNGASEVEILGPGEGEHRRMTMAEAGGIEARVRMTNDVLVYEMKMPLLDNGSHPFAIGTKAGALLGVGVDATRLQERARSQEEPAEGGEGRGGGFGGRGGGGGRGGRGGRGGGGGGGRAGSGGQGEPFKLWAKVQLALQETPAH